MSSCRRWSRRRSRREQQLPRVCGGSPRTRAVQRYPAHRSDSDPAPTRARALIPPSACNTASLRSHSRSHIALAHHSIRTPEEQAANFEIVKEYQRGLSRRHNKMWRELRCKIDLKWAAVDELPTARDREEAKVVPEEPFPAAPIRFPLLDTPPIPNFAELKSRGRIVFPKR